MGYSKEELLENLPDFINNKIGNEDLKKAIENEILVNPDFKEEFELLNSTLSEINNLKYSEPPVNYFETLLPRINERIYEKQDKFRLIFFLSRLWKFAVPVAAVILFFIGYKTIFRNSDYINDLNTNTDTQIVMNDLNYSDEKITDTSVGSNETADIENAGMESENPEVKTEYKPVKTYDNQVVRKSNTQKEENLNAFIDQQENADDDFLLLNFDENSYEKDFEKMNKEEQNNIILKIKNSNL